MKKISREMIQARCACEAMKGTTVFNGDYLLQYAVTLGEAKKVLTDAMSKCDNFDDNENNLLGELDMAFCEAREWLEKIASRVEVLPAIVGEYIHTPRFLNVRIDRILCEIEARELGFTEPSHYKNDKYDVFGKSTGLNTMIFALVRKGAAG